MTRSKTACTTSQTLQKQPNDQLTLMCWHLEVTESDFGKFCKFMGVKSVKEMTVGQFFEANKAINAKVEKLNRRAVK